MKNGRDRNVAASVEADGLFWRPVFEPSWQCVARHVVLFTCSAGAIGTFGQWITGREIWSVGYLGTLVVLAAILFAAVCFGPRRMRALLNRAFE